MSNFKEDISGKVFGKLKVIEYAGYNKNRSSVWKCQCECGKITDVSKMHLGNTTSCGCSRIKGKDEFVGKKFGKLKVLRFAGTNGHNSVWECECECGKTINALKSNIKKAKSCGCTWRSYGEDNCRWTGYKEISGKSWLAIKNNAKNRDIDFDITLEYIWNLFVEQNKKCAISGVKIALAKHCTASLDRINNSKGYVVGNVQWVHKLINRMKMDLCEDLFFKLCGLIFSTRGCKQLTDEDIEIINSIVLRQKQGAGRVG